MVIIKLKPSKTKIDLLITVSLFLTYCYFITQIRIWVTLTSIYIVFLLVFAVLIVLTHTIQHFKKTEHWYKFNIYTVIKLIFTFIFLYPIILMFDNSHSSSINLSYPLKSGSYIVTHGGENMFNNHHQNLNSPYHEYNGIYALDIVKLNKYGSDTKTWSSQPSRLEDYEIFSDTIYSPCDGIVWDFISDANDHEILNSPFESSNRGNYIRINHNKKMVALGHLKKGSIMVVEGDSVKTGQPIAMVGNSGYSTTPHLHIHTYYREASIANNGDTLRELVPVVMKFNNRIMKRNSIF